MWAETIFETVVIINEGGLELLSYCSLPAGGKERYSVGTLWLEHVQEAVVIVLYGI